MVVLLLIFGNNLTSSSPVGSSVDGLETFERVTSSSCVVMKVGGMENGGTVVLGVVIGTGDCPVVDVVIGTGDCPVVDVVIGTGDCPVVDVVIGTGDCPVVDVVI